MAEAKGSLQDRSINVFRESNDFPSATKVGVEVENDATNPVPVYIVDGEPGTPIHLQSGIVATTPGIIQSLISFTVPALTARDCYQATVVCRSHGRWEATLNGSIIIASGRTGPASPNSKFSWSPRRILSSGDTIALTFKAVSDAPISEAEAYFMSSDRSTV